MMQRGVAYAFLQRQKLAALNDSRFLSNVEGYVGVAKVFPVL
jgi:hypothetical protein